LLRSRNLDVEEELEEMRLECEDLREGREEL